MWYRGALTVLAGTTRAAYVSTEVEICRGFISSFYRLFPPGCAGLVALQVYHQTRQIFPTTPGQYYLGDDSEILAETSVDIAEPPFVLELRAWAPEAVYDHILYCEFYIERLRVLVPVPIEQVIVPGV